MHCDLMLSTTTGIAVDTAQHDKSEKSGATTDDKSGPSETSANREESMGDSANDAFGKQSSASSGTTPLTSEPSDANEKTTPGGVEGVSGNS